MNELNNDMYYFETVDMIPAEIYYHYTSLDALYSIVTSKTFRLTSLRSSNDKKELSYKLDDFIEDFENICIVEQNENIKKYFDMIRQSIKLNMNDFSKICKEKTYPYALCLSEKKDNLTHWDRYASKCTGVSIGLNVSALRVLMKRNAISAFGAGVYDVGKVFYTTETRKSYIKRRVKCIIDRLVQAGERDNDHTDKTVREFGFIYAAIAYLSMEQFVKDSSFLDEGEVRLYHDAASIKRTTKEMKDLILDIEPELYKPFKRNFRNFIDQLQLKEDNFYISPKGIRSYKKMCLEKVWGQGVIPEIILGPMCVQNKAELRRFLDVNGLQGTKISISKVPIR